ncbi:short-chain dehydrogenase/reductase-like protein SDR [Cadophora sp. MPI-SDFR-AT-0126]|nr:short-chain dehydrogenase/reductase-like protein SDR [Leotiomycetes sp. MPI-SDFR-AT-0126]
MSTNEPPVWLITGCSSGLGASLCTLISQSRSHRLIATARNPSTLSYLPQKSPNILTLALDVTSPSSISTAFSTGLSHFGRIDYVVNNAGYGIFAEAEGTEEEDARGMFETNFWGSAKVALEAVRVFREGIFSGRGGILIQVSSLLGRVAGGGQTYYSASKFAIEGFIEALSKELHPKWNIRILIAEPGAIKSTAFNANILAQREIHPAYSDPDCPTNKTRQWLAKPNLEEDFTPVDEMARTLFEAVAKKGLSFRVPLGQDSWEAIYADVSEGLETLKGCRTLSERPSKQIQH